jgi:plastocyanin domain-containing protein
MTLLSTSRRRRPRTGDTTGTSGETLVRVRGGYEPSVIHVRAGVPVRLIFLREEIASCSEQVVFPDFGKSAMLPPGREVTVELAACGPGTYEFTCAMGILRGSLVVT